MRANPRSGSADRSPREAAEFVIAKLVEAGHEALLAGGCVRDLLLGREPKDYDVATDAHPERVADLFRRTEMVGAKFGVVIVWVMGRQVEVATFRSDGRYTDGRHPDSVTFGDQRADAARRDFTINGMFLDVASGTIIDHVGGREDLDQNLLRAIGEPRERFVEDHLRMLRAVRFAARLGFEIESRTMSAIQEESHLLSSISPERVREELKLILCDASRGRGWRLMQDAGLCDYLVRGLSFDPLTAELVVKRLEDAPENTGFSLALALVLRDQPSGNIGIICKSLTCSNAEVRKISWLLRQLDRAKQPDDLELADVKMMMADEGFRDLLDLLHAELVSLRLPMVAFDELTRWSSSIPPEEVAPPPFVRGEDLMDQNVPQGPIYAELLDRLYREQLNGTLPDKQTSLRRLTDLLSQLG